MVYAPRDFQQPQVTDYRKNIAGSAVNILAGSSVRLLADLRALAPELGIGLGVDLLLDDETAKRIDDMEPLHGDDDTPRTHRGLAHRVAPDA